MSPPRYVCEDCAWSTEDPRFFTCPQCGGVTEWGPDIVRHDPRQLTLPMEETHV